MKDKTYKILGYILCVDGINLTTVKAKDFTEDKKEFIENIVYLVPKVFEDESKYLYMVNNNQHYSSLIGTTDLDSSIKHYETCLKENVLYDEIPTLKETHKIYLELLKFKKENPKAIFGKGYNWK